MSVLGISLGAHSVYVAVYNDENSTTQVFCDELGNRSFPSCVAFREGCGDAHSMNETGTQCEILVGLSAKQQQAKNPSNTFTDLRTLIFDPELATVTVPLMQKDITVQELVSYLFRHILNQVKQQTVAKSKPIKDAFVCLPANAKATALETIKNRLIDAAKLGGIRIRGFCEESVAPIVALSFDRVQEPSALVAVIDFGWTGCSISFFRVSNGIFSPLFSDSNDAVSVKSFHDKCVAFCVKDFLRRFKLDCSESTRSISRLSLQCEQGIKILANSQETTIVIDSLFEGSDYSVKISRSRFEDLCSPCSLAFRHLLTSSLVSAELDAASVNHVVLAGGGGAHPFVQTIAGNVFTSASFPKNRYECVELSCVGAAANGGYILSTSPDADIKPSKVDFICDDILIADAKELQTAENVMSLFPKGTILPSAERVVFPVSLESQSYQFYVIRASSASGESEVIGDVCFVVEGSSAGCNNATEFTICFSASCQNCSSVPTIAVYLVSNSSESEPKVIGSIPL